MRCGRWCSRRSGRSRTRRTSSSIGTSCTPNASSCKLQRAETQTPLLRRLFVAACRFCLCLVRCHRCLESNSARAEHLRTSASFVAPLSSLLPLLSSSPLCATSCHSFAPVLVSRSSSPASASLSPCAPRVLMLLPPPRLASAPRASAASLSSPSPTHLLLSSHCVPQSKPRVPCALRVD